MKSNLLNALFIGIALIIMATGFVNCDEPERYTPQQSVETSNPAPQRAPIVADVPNDDVLKTDYASLYDEPCYKQIKSWQRGFINNLNSNSSSSSKVMSASGLPKTNPCKECPELRKYVNEYEVMCKKETEIQELYGKIGQDYIERHQQNMQILKDATKSFLEASYPKKE